MYASAAELPLIGGHPALDLVNTVEPRVPLHGAQAHDHLVDPPALLLWARRAGLLDDREAEAVASAWAGDRAAAPHALRAVRDIREALYTAVLAAIGAAPQETPAPASDAALERLRLRWAAAAGRSTLVLDRGGAVVARLLIGASPALLLPDRAADAALDLLRTADPARLRGCPADRGGCGWVFLDRSRNRSRRWCQMADCGARVKARRLTERRRAARA